MTTAAMHPACCQRLLLFGLGFVLLSLSSCGSYEDKRIREMMVEKGFGTRAQGNATQENYIGGRDLVQFLLPPEVLTLDGWERLAELQVAQPIGLDGTIHVPYVGPVYVLGMTEAEATTLVKSQLHLAGLATEVDLEAFIMPGVTKVFYAIGEVALKGPIPMQTDLTFFDALFLCKWTALANLGRVYLIRPDAEHPLVVDINYREMLLTGYTVFNVPIHEHDIIYIPPTFIGLVARLLERLLQPVRLAVGTVLGAAQITTAYDVLTGRGNGLYFRY